VNQRPEDVTAQTTSNNRPDTRPRNRLAQKGQRFEDRAAGSLVVDFTDGQRLEYSGSRPGPNAHITVRNRRAFRRFHLGGAIGGAESYIDGDWDTVDLSAALEFFARNEAELDGGFGGGRLAGLVRRLYHLTRANTRRGSRRNIAAHYDLGNEFYEAWLDPGMAYSCAIFEDDRAPSREADLATAQIGKYRRLCDRLAIGPDHHLLEIGCGWGGFAEYVASEVGCKVTGITISKEQHDHARRRIYNAGLAERVSIDFQDYRDIAGRYDRVASIEMFEAVGERYWPAFFGKLKDSLSAGGRAALQIITIDDGRFERYLRGTDFIQRYIFPGGVLPSRAALAREVADAGLTWLGDEGFGRHYAETLSVWRERFAAARARIEALGYPDRFRRMWDFYLAYCEAGFRTGRTDLLQISIGR
jgi:cyclopropane-fatty-acyl-phospholipid synthase